MTIIQEEYEYNIFIKHNKNRNDKSKNHCAFDNSNDDCDVFEKINKADYYFINIFYTNFFLVLILSYGIVIFFI